MYKRYFVFVILIWICNTGFCQDFNFRWVVQPSPVGTSYQIFIEKKQNKGHMIIKESGRKDSTLKKMNPGDCDSLKAFLDRYQFQTIGYIVYGPKERYYLKTNVLPDTNWIQINGDSIRRSMLYVLGYYFDKDSNACYREYQTMDFIKGGNSYQCLYVTNQTKKKSYIHGGRLSESDVRLNYMILNLLKKYDHHRNYNQLENILDEDKPGKK